MTTTTFIDNSASEEHWMPMLSDTETVPVDFVIEAFEQGVSHGRKKGREDVILTLREKTNENAKHCTQLADKIFELLLSSEFQVLGIFLRTNGIFSWQILVAVHEDSFVADEFDDIYPFIWALTKEVSSETFHPIVHFMPVINGDINKINKDALTSDGYIYRFRRAEA